MEESRVEMEGRSGASWEVAVCEEGRTDRLISRKAER